MILLGSGIDLPESLLREMCYTTLMGTEALKAVDAVRQLGIPNSGKHTLAFDQLKELISASEYPIVFVSLLPLDLRDDNHAMVVIEMDVEKVIALDPLRGEREISIDIFHQAWERRHNLAILVKI
jgi:predicted double-glycine peptidase